MGGSRRNQNHRSVRKVQMGSRLYLSRLPAVTLLAGTEALAPSDPESLLLCVRRSAIPALPPVLTLLRCPPDPSHTSLPRRIHVLQILPLQVFFTFYKANSPSETGRGKGKGEKNPVTSQNGLSKGFLHFRVSCNFCTRHHLSSLGR